MVMALSAMLNTPSGLGTRGTDTPDAEAEVR